MTPIQLLLLIVIVAIAVFYIRYLRSPFSDRVVALAFIATGGVAVLRPELTSTLAHTLGVGRGTDLLLYLSFSFGAFLLMLLYTKISRVEAKLIRLVSELAMRDR